MKRQTSLGRFEKRLQLLWVEVSIRVLSSRIQSVVLAVSLESQSEFIPVELSWVGSFLQNPLANVGGAMPEFCAVTFTAP